MPEVKGVIQAKSDTTGGVKLNDAWFTVEEAVKPYLAKVSKGDTISATTVKKGYKTFIVKLVKETVAQAETATQQEASKTEAPKSSAYASKSEDVQERITRGNAINAASARLSGLPMTDAIEAAQEIIVMAEELVRYIQGAK